MRRRPEEAATPATAAHARPALVAARSMEQVLRSLDPAARIASARRPERFSDTRAAAAARHAQRGALAASARAAAETVRSWRAASVSSLVEAAPTAMARPAWTI